MRGNRPFFDVLIKLVTENSFPAFRHVLYTNRLNPNIQAWTEQLRSGDIRALSRAISTVENRAPGWSELLKALFPHSGKARVLGLTGPPGAGKSTLVDQLARFYRKDNRTVGIIAVDPTSPYTGGAILGDRIRMQEHFADPGIYIRSMATRGSLGGLARAFRARQSRLPIRPRHPRSIWRHHERAPSERPRPRESDDAR